MTNNPTIDGVSRELLERLLTDTCNENWSDMNEPLNSSAECRCRRFGKDNPHWPCPVHSVRGDPHGPSAAMTEAGCQAYMDADGMIGIMHNSSMGHAYVAMRTLDPEVAALQSTIAQLQARIAELESGRGESIKLQHMAVAEDGKLRWMSGRKMQDCELYAMPDGSAIRQPMFTAPPAPVAEPEKYDDVLLPFLALMRAELHANAHKGDRPGWLGMGRNTAILEIFYHMGKLHQAVHRYDAPCIKEYAADVANMCMMLLDVCACLDATAALNNKPSTEVNP